MRNQLNYYCTTKTFHEIITTGKIRFSDVRKSNDREEIQYLMDLYYKVCPDKQDTLAGISLDYLFRQGLDHTTYYCLCLSKSRDSLSMWRGYTPEGGFSIGFDSKRLRKWCKEIRFNDSEKHVEIESVDYRGESSDKLKKWLRELEESNNIFDTTSGIGIKPQEGFLPKLFSIAPIYKSKGFREEKEIRAFFAGSPEQNLSKEENKDAPDVTIMKNWEIRNGKLVTSYDIPFPKEIIVEVIIGPNTNMGENEVQQFLSSFGFHNAAVSTTALSYRKR